MANLASLDANEPGLKNMKTIVSHPEKCRRWSVALAAILAVGPGVAAEPSASEMGVRQLSAGIADLVERTLPSVVVIQTAAVRYHRVIDPFLGRGYAVPERLAGQGSGAVLDREGHILTSAHVVSGAQRINVVFNDETVRPARIVGMDEASDVAVLQLTDLKGLDIRPIPLGDSDAIRIGEFVVAIGSPFNLQGSVSFGVLSQKGRSVGVLPYEDFLQTDAAINPGNSGGPLMDIHGRMIGINAVIQTGGPQAQGNIGIGFAVPINFARRVAESIIRTGRYERPWIGIRPMMPREGAGAGLIVGQVFADTPAERGGLRAGDVIVEADGQRIQNIRDLLRVLMRRGIGDTVQLRVRRGNRTVELKLPTERMPDLEPSDR